MKISRPIMCSLLRGGDNKSGLIRTHICIRLPQCAVIINREHLPCKHTSHVLTSASIKKVLFCRKFCSEHIKHNEIPLTDCSFVEAQNTKAPPPPLGAKFELLRSFFYLNDGWLNLVKAKKTAKTVLFYIYSACGRLSGMGSQKALKCLKNSSTHAAALRTVNGTGHATWPQVTRCVLGKWGWCDPCMANLWKVFFFSWNI